MLENGIKINSDKSTAVSFMRAWVKAPPNCSLLDEIMLEANSCKYLGIIISSDLCWIDHVNYTMKVDWKALYITIHIFKRGYCYRKSSTYTVLVHPILEYGVCLGSKQGETDKCV